MKTGAQITQKASIPATADKTPTPAPEMSHDDAPDIETQLDVARLGHSFASVGITPAPQGAIQPKLTVGAADDKYEDEADRVAGQVVRMPDSAVQRVTPDNDQDKIRTKLDIQRAADGSFAAGANVESRIAARHGGGSPLADATRAFMEPRFGADFSGVRVHADAEADQISQDLSARAFTTGSDIYFRQGEYSPSSSGGQALLAHELTHVVQQAAVDSKKETTTDPGITTTVSAQLTETDASRIQRMQPLIPNPVNRIAALNLNGVAGHVWRAQTNAGNWVTVWVPPGNANANHSHFCHGHALNTWALHGYTPTSGQAMTTILHDEYQFVGNVIGIHAVGVNVGDIVVWYDNTNQPVHSARITVVAATPTGQLDPNNTMLTSKNGANPIVNASLTVVDGVYPHATSRRIFR